MTANSSLKSDGLSSSTAIGETLAALRTVLGTPDHLIQLHEPEFAGREWEYIKSCLDTGWVSSAGMFVDSFERQLVDFTGAAYAVATSNGTSALHTCLVLAGVRPGDEVLVPTLTFVATANAVTYAQATPHFVDSEAVSLGVDAKKLDDYLNGHAKLIDGTCVNRHSGACIRALVVMHVFGHPADLHALDEVAKRWRITLIEDAAESLGSTYHGVHTGNFGLLAALSFNGNKVVTTGGGGAVLTNDQQLARRAKHITTTARMPHKWNFVHDEIGYNYRMPNLNAALGCAQLERLPSMIARKRALAARYSAAFSSVRSAKFLSEPDNTRSNYWLNAILLENGNEGDRDKLLDALNAAQYGSRPVWTLMHRLPMYVACPRMDVSIAQNLAARLVNLPSSASLGG